MSIAELSVLIAAIVIACANGANDVSKGIATLVGAGVTGYRRAILWGTVWTTVGGIASAFFATALVGAFGKGILAPGTVPTFAAGLAAILAATLWVAFATWRGWPVSTTHAIVGSIAGVAVFAYGIEGVLWSRIAGRLLLPLLISPIASLVLTWLILRSARAWGRGEGETDDCLCAEIEAAAGVVPANGMTAGMAALEERGARLTIVTGQSEECATELPSIFRITLDRLHWMTSAATSFARGLNDAPKMVALVVVGSMAAPDLPALLLFAAALVAVGMGLGSAIGGRKVTNVLAERVTRMNHREGFVANLVTATLVGSGAVFGLPMSTTHVSAGGIIGAGVERGAGSIARSTVRDMLFAWVLTAPACVALGALASVTLKALLG